MNTRKKKPTLKKSVRRTKIAWTHPVQPQAYEELSKLITMISKVPPSTAYWKVGV